MDSISKTGTNTINNILNVLDVCVRVRPKIIDMFWVIFPVTRYFDTMELLLRRRNEYGLTNGGDPSAEEGSKLH